MTVWTKSWNGRFRFPYGGRKHPAGRTSRSTAQRRRRTSEGRARRAAVSRAVHYPVTGGPDPRRIGARSPALPSSGRRGIENAGGRVGSLSGARGIGAGGPRPHGHACRHGRQVSRQLLGFQRKRLASGSHPPVPCLLLAWRRRVRMCPLVFGPGPAVMAELGVFSKRREDRDPKG